MQVADFRKDACRHTQIQHRTLAESGETSIEMLPLVTVSVSRSLELCRGCLEKPIKKPHCVLWDCGMAGWGKHSSNTVYCALVEELCSERMSTPHSKLLYCTFISADSFYFFRHWCLHLS